MFPLYVQIGARSPITFVSDIQIVVLHVAYNLIHLIVVIKRDQVSLHFSTSYVGSIPIKMNITFKNVKTGADLLESTCYIGYIQSTRNT